MQHAGQLQVVDVAAATGEDSQILDPQGRGADAAGAADHGGRGPEASSSSHDLLVATEPGLRPPASRLRRSSGSPYTGRCCPTGCAGSRPRSGAGSRAASATVVMTKPGVQKPHWKPWLSRKDCCSGERSSGEPRPSIVSIVDPFGLHGQHQARTHRLAVDQHGAGAADTVLAADVGAGQFEIVAQKVDQRAAHLGRGRVFDPVHPQCDLLDGHVASFRDGERFVEAAADEHAGEMTSVGTGAVQVGGGGDLVGRRVRGRGKSRVARPTHRATTASAAVGPKRLAGDSAQADPNAGDRRVGAELERDRAPDQGEVAVTPSDLVERPAAARTEQRGT